MLGKWLIRIACGVGGIAGLGLALLYFFQDKILYVPRVPGLPNGIWKYPNEFGLDYEDVSITTEDGVELHGWLLWARGWSKESLKTRPVVMFFQENAGNMSFRLPFLRLLVLRQNVVVFAMSYRGYGLSKGKPSEAGLKLDAAAGLRYVLARDDLDASRVVLFGRSLGGAVTLHLAAQQQQQDSCAVKAVIVENTFTAVQDMVARVVPPLSLLIGKGRPCNWLVTNRWNNLEAVTRVQVPLLMMVSVQDEMVPSSQMYALYAAQRAPAVELVEFAHASHMDAYDVEQQKYWGALAAFFNKYVDA